MDLAERLLREIDKDNREILGENMRNKTKNKQKVREQKL